MKDKEAIKIIQLLKKKNNGLSLNNKILRENPSINNYLVHMLEKYPWYVTINNVFILVSRGIVYPVKCKVCGKEVPVNSVKSYNVKTCSKQCRYELSPMSAKITCLKKYGVDNVAKLNKSKEKAKITCLKKYGVDNFRKTDQYCDKYEQTCLNKYGVTSSNQASSVKLTKKKSFEDKYGVRSYSLTPMFLKQIRKTIKSRYGVIWNTQIPEIKTRLRQKGLELGFDGIKKWSSHVMPLFSKDDYVLNGSKHNYFWRCVRCGNEFEQKIRSTGHLKNNQCVPRCLVCYPYLSGFSCLERDVADFIKSFYFGEVIENNRSVISPLELDIYLPERRLAIEFDGLFWHNDKNKDGSYHLNKTEQCEKLGIQLIHIFEDEWVEKQEIVKSRIKALLNIFDRRVYARKCVVKEINCGVSNKFLEANHLQGRDASSIRYGLYFNNELVSVMTFGKPRFNKSHDYELMRFCSKLNCQVLGGASKLLKHFQNNHVGSIVSYADRRYSVGKLYQLLGFQLQSVSDPNYWWTKRDKKLSRYQCQKHRLRELLGEGFNPELSEAENMEFNGYSRIFDCGNKAWTFETGRVN